MRKIWMFVIVILLILLVIASVVKISGNSVVNSNGNSGTNLDKYSSNSIPAECRLPEGQDLQGWKEHLGHHENTKYCLEYYK